MFLCIVDCINWNMVTGERKRNVRTKALTAAAWLFACASILMFLLPGIFGQSMSFDQYGTFVGGTSGPLAALAAFIFVYKNFLQQQEQVNKHEEQFLAQSFEHSFFNLLNYYKSFMLGATIYTHNDRMSVEEFKEYVSKYDEQFPGEFGPSSIDQSLEVTPQTVEDHAFKEYLYGRYEEGQLQIRYLFKPLLSVLLLIREADIKDKQKYYQIFRHQVPEYEKFILFYLYVVCRPSLYSAVEYDLMLDIIQHIDPKSLILEDHLGWLSHPPYEPEYGLF